MSLIVVLDQHAGDFSYLLVTERELKARVDQIAYHLLSLVLIDKTSNQLQTEVLRKRHLNFLNNIFSLRLLLWLGLLFGFLFVLSVGNSLAVALIYRLGAFRL